MVDQRQIAAPLRADDRAFQPDRSQLWSAIRRANEAIRPMFWGRRIALTEACAAIRSWLDANLGGGGP
jgi:hypothetical protein